MVDRAGVGTVERLPSEDCDGNCNKTLHYLSIDLPLCDTFFLDVPEQICENSGSPLDRNPHCVFFVLNLWGASSSMLMIAFKPRWGVLKEQSGVVYRQHHTISNLPVASITLHSYRTSRDGCTFRSRSANPHASLSEKLQKMGI